MKATIKYFTAILLTVFIFQSCQDIDDVAAPIHIEIQDFIWKGMNKYYLWQADVPNLADDRFASQAQLNLFLRTYDVPEDLFDALRVDPSIDRFSWIVNDYVTLEQSFQGTSKNNGIDFGLSYKPGSSTEIFGWVRYIIPNSDASTKNIKRGDFFYGVNGTQLTLDNYQSLLYGANENYTLNMADYDGTSLVSNGTSVTVTKTVLNENPIFINKVIDKGAHKIGYLMYNGFYSDYDTDLNNAFGSLKTQGITDLVLDLRYNGGGSVLTATRLASMITGQFTGDLFAKLNYNSKLSANNTNYLFTNKIGSAGLNSLNLTTVYVLTTKSTASASELIINGLHPYINAVQIGDYTYGKNVASRTLYDSPDFSANKRNPNHRYAMQPIIANVINSVGFGDYTSGLTPTYELKEYLSTLGVLGEETEPLLSTAIGKITGTAKMVKENKGVKFKYLTDSKTIFGQNEMHIE